MDRIQPLIATPRRTRDILETFSFTFKKSLGQNFIIDPNILEKMIRHSSITKETGVIEIGPGIGSLTELLARHAKHVVAFEIDQRLVSILEDTLASYSNITVVHEDFLRVNLQEAIDRYFPNQQVQVLANLPYYITTPILMHIIESQVAIDKITVMLQKEVAERIVAQPNSKAYGSLSIAIQYYMDVEIVMDVPNTVFMPQPKVTSAIISLMRRKNPIANVKNEQLFFEVVRVSFSHRRKTIRNNLLQYYRNTLSREKITTALEEAFIDSSRRAESITIEEFVQLANVLEDYLANDRE